MEMERTELRDRSRWPSLLAVVAGAWLIVSPLLLGYQGAPSGRAAVVGWNELVVGVLVVAFGLARWRGAGTWASWALMLIGAYELAAPTLIGTDWNVPRNNEIWLGSIVLLLGLVSAFTQHDTPVLDQILTPHFTGAMPEDETQEALEPQNDLYGPRDAGVGPAPTARRTDVK